MAYHTTCMSTGEHLREAMRRYGITAPQLGALLNLTKGAVYEQTTRDNWTEGSLQRYADALTAVLRDRGDLRRFTAASLQAGPHPEPLGAPASVAVAEERSAVVHHVTEGGGLGRLLVVPYYDALHCGWPGDPLAEDPAQLAEVRAELAGPGATEQNTVVMRVRGESMSGAGIGDGDELVIRTDRTPRGGDVVVYRGGDGAACGKLDREGRRILSHHADGRVPVDIQLLGRVVLIGVAVGHQRRLVNWS